MEYSAAVAMENAREKDQTASDLVANNCLIDNEGTPLLHVGSQSHCSWLSWLAMRCGGTRKCVSSKAVLLILLWAFATQLAMFVWIPTNFVFIASLLTDSNETLVSYFMGVSYDIVFYSFYPLAGFLADVKYGRYKTIFVSLCLILVSLIIFLLVVGPLVAVAIATSSRIALILLCVSGSILIIVFRVGSVGFAANLVWTNSMILQEKTEPSSYTGLCGLIMPVHCLFS